MAWTPSAAVALIAFFAIWSFARPLDFDDLGWHLRVGQFVLAHHAIPWTNIFCWPAPDHRFVPHEWLSGTVFAVLYALGGARALLLCRSVCFTATLLLLLRLGRRHGAEPMGLALLMVAAGWTLAKQGTLRPWLFTNLLLVVEIDLLDRWRGGVKIPLAIAAMLVVWVNLHGGFLLGLVFLIASLGAAVWQRRIPVTHAAACGVAAIAACLVTPLGWHALAYPLGYFLRDDDGSIAMMKKVIVEWTPIEPLSSEALLWVLAAVPLAAALWRHRAVRKRVDAWIAVLFLLYALRERRYVVAGGVLAFPGIVDGLLVPFAARVRVATGGFVARVGAYSRMESLPRRPAATVLAVAIVGFALLWRHGPGFEASRMEPNRYPLGAIEALNALPTGRLLNQYLYGGPLAWKAPDHPVFVIGIHDALPKDVFADDLKFEYLLPGWQEALERRRIDQVLFPTTNPLTAELEKDPAWKRVYADEYATLLTRDLPP